MAPTEGEEVVPTEGEEVTPAEGEEDGSGGKSAEAMREMASGEIIRSEAMAPSRAETKKTARMEGVASR